MSTIIYFLGQDMTLTVDRLRTPAGEYVATAVVEATLYDADGVAVVGQTWPLVLGYVSDSRGTYRGVLLAALDVVENQRCTLRVTATVDGYTARWDLPFLVAKRTADDGMG